MRIVLVLQNLEKASSLIRAVDRATSMMRDVTRVEIVGDLYNPDAGRAGEGYTIEGGRANEAWCKLRAIVFVRG